MQSSLGVYMQDTFFTVPSVPCITEVCCLQQNHVNEHEKKAENDAALKLHTLT